jgi:dolichol-phosphate mannosyltransferase
MDCDEQHEPEMIPAFIEAINADDSDVISGSRYMSVQPDGDLPPGDRRAINATITAMLNELFGWHLTDSFCGFKAHRVSAMRRLHLTETGYAFPLQFWPQVYEAGLRVSEIPVRLIYNDPTRHFGGLLDDAAIRLQHYKDVLSAELRRMQDAVPMSPLCSRTSCCCE